MFHFYSGNSLINMVPKHLKTILIVFSLFLIPFLKAVNARITRDELEYTMKWLNRRQQEEIELLKTRGREDRQAIRKLTEKVENLESGYSIIGNRLKRENTTPLKLANNNVERYFIYLFLLYCIILSNSLHKINIQLFIQFDLPN